MPDPLPQAEDVGLYVMDLLEPEAKRTFEAALAASPELRQQVAEMQVVVEGLALAAPPCPPPPRVWHAIADRTRQPLRPVRPSSSGGSRWRFVWAALSNGWAVAVLVGLAFAGHLLFQSPGVTASLPRPAASATPPGDGTPGLEPASPGRGLAASTPRRTNTSFTSGTGGSPTNSGARPGEDPARLQERIRLLSEQVAHLTHVLTQHTALPAGASRLQVFRLISTNATTETTETPFPDPRGIVSTHADPAAPPTAVNPPESSTSATTAPDVSLALALAAARQLAAVSPVATTAGRNLTSVVTPPPSAIPDGAGVAPPVTDTTTPTTDPGTARDPILVVDLAPTPASVPTHPTTPTSPSTETSVVSLADTAAFGSFSPDTGTGAIAFRIPNDALGQGVLQLWLSDSASSTIQSLGFTPVSGAGATPGVMVMKFQVVGETIAMPTFLITREPVGGSSQPTGPIVAQPPANLLPTNP